MLKAVQVWPGITYGKFVGRFHFPDGIEKDARQTPYPLSIVNIRRSSVDAESKYESIVFIPVEVKDNFLASLLGAGIYNKKVNMCIRLIKHFLNADN